MSLRLWPWRHRGRELARLIEQAERRDAYVAQAGRDARLEVTLALDAERRQKRLNHLGLLAHDALTTPGRPKHP